MNIYTSVCIIGVALVIAGARTYEIRRRSACFDHGIEAGLVAVKTLHGIAELVMASDADAAFELKKTLQSEIASDIKRTVFDIQKSGF